MAHRHKDNVLDIQDAQEIEVAADNVVAVDHPEFVEHAEKVMFKTWLAIFFLGVLYACVQGINLIPLNVINVIAADLPPSSAVTWIASGYSFALGIGVLVANALSDVLGRRWFIIGGGILVIVSDIVGGTAQTIPAVIAATTLGGLGQGGVTCIIAAAGEIVPRRWRGPVIGALNTGLGVWIVSGSLVGHALVVHTGPGWRSVFWMSLGINGVATIGVALTYFPATPLASFRASGKSFLRDFDWVGLIGIVSAEALILLGIIWITTFGAKSAHFLAPFIIGVVLVVPLTLHQIYVARNPLLHPELFRRVRTFTLMCAVGLVGGMLFYALEDFFSTYLQLIYDGGDQVKIGVDNIPFAIGTNTGGVLSAVLLPILGPRIGTQWMLTIGVVFQVLFIPLMSIPGVTGRPMALAFSALGGFGIGIMELLTILLIQYAAPDEYLGFSYGILGLFRGIGGSAGTSIYTTIFLNKSATLVPTRVAAAALTAGLPETSLTQLLEILTGAIATPITAVPGINVAIIEASALALKQAYLAAFRYVWLSSIPFGIISLICAICTKDLSDQLTLKTPQHLKNVVQLEDIEREKARTTIIRERGSHELANVKT